MSTQQRSDSRVSPADWERIETLLNHALELSSEEREPFLDRSCSHWTWAREELASLLRSAQRLDPDFMDEAPIMLLVRPPSATAGPSLGPYRIVRSLGSGGMGDVYLAIDNRSEEQVAIKTLRFGCSEGEFVKRFQREREILARLDHQHIARLHDGGAAADGTHFLVMEYVDGEPLDIYSKSRQPSIVQCLRLFSKICSAVQYLHEQQVLHRDLKPSNVMIRADGEPKLLDFGIAKLYGPEHATRTPLTGCGPGPMSLDYASPEQLRGQAATAASEIYALGVLLYELLTGGSPHAGTGSLQDTVEKICFKTPVKPSLLIARRAAPGDDLSGECAFDDLDAIVLKTLAKSPSERYGSVAALRDDVESYLGSARK